MLFVYYNLCAINHSTVSESISNSFWSSGLIDQMVRFLVEKNSEWRRVSCIFLRGYF